MGCHVTGFMTELNMKAIPVMSLRIAVMPLAGWLDGACLDARGRDQQPASVLQRIWFARTALPAKREMALTLFSMHQKHRR
jgi:hypothetical protein